MKDAVGADAHEDLGADIGEPNADGDRVVAGVEHEHRDVVAGEKASQSLDLVDGGSRGLHARLDPHDVEGGGPGVRRPVELGDPLVAPSRHDGLAVGVFGGRVVEAALGAAFGVAAVPGRRVDGEHQRPGRGRCSTRALRSQSVSMLPLARAL